MGEFADVEFSGGKGEGDGVLGAFEGGVFDRGFEISDSEIGAAVIYDD